MHLGVVLPAVPTSGPIAASSIAADAARRSVTAEPDAAPACGATNPTSKAGPTRKFSRTIG